MKTFRSIALSLGILVLIFCLILPQRGSSRTLSAAVSDDAATQEASAKYTTTARINQIRRTLGLPALAQEPLLDLASEHHSAYMDAAGQVSFEENPDNAGFTGGYPVNRAAYSRYDGLYIMEYDNYRMVSYEYFVDWCMQDPYLRTSLLSPYYADIGYARSGYYYCMMLGGPADAAGTRQITAVYPYAGQQDVGYVNLSSLSLVPEEIRENGQSSIGVPVTLQYYADDAEEFRFENISAQILNTDTEETLETVIVTPQDENGIWNTLILFPTQPYKASTRYTVTIAFDVFVDENLVDKVSEKWSFTTVGPEYISGVRTEDVLTALLEALQAPDYVIRRRVRELVNGDEYATREQTIVMMIDLLVECAPEVMETITPDYKETFEDINDCGEENRDKVQMAYQMRLIEDQGRGILNPKAIITRAELAQMTSKLHTRFQVDWAPDTISPPIKPGHR